MNCFCRLCLTKCEESIAIFSEYGKEQNIAAIISKYFWFGVLEYDKSNENSISPIICKLCWNSIDSFNKFYINIEAVHHNNEMNLLLFPCVEIMQNTSATESKAHTVEGQQIHKTVTKNIPTFNDKLLSNNTCTEDDCGDGQENVKIEDTLKSNCDKNNILKENEEDIDEHQDINGDLDDDDDDDVDNDNDYDPINDDEINKLHKEINSKKRIRKSKKLKNKESKFTNKRNYTKITSDRKLALQNEKKEKQNQMQEKSIQDANEMRQYFDMKCDVCDKVLDSLKDAQRHYRIDHGRRKGYIKCCGRKFFQRFRALEHIKYHLNPDTYKCTICNKSYLDNKGLNNHMEVHLPSESKQYKCHLCTLSFAKLCKLTQHVRVSHADNEEKNFICDLCNKSYKTKGILSSHLRHIHLAPIRHVCDICAKIFRSKRVLEDHRGREHLNIVEPRVQCTICGAWLKHLRALQMHVMRHKTEPQPCVHCGKIKPNKDALRKHIRAVHEIVTEWHSCTICDKSFKKAIVLKEHMASHTGEALYTCTYCPKTFNSNANMHSHRKKMHPVEWENARLKRYLLQ